MPGLLLPLVKLSEANVIESFNCGIIRTEYCIGIVLALNSTGPVVVPVLNNKSSRVYTSIKPPACKTLKLVPKKSVLSTLLVAFNCLSESGFL